MKNKMIMVIDGGSEHGRLSASVAIGQPNKAGHVKLASAVPWGNGQAEAVPSTCCFEFDAPLLERFNEVVGSIKDKVETAQSIMIASSRHAFPDDEDEENKAPKTVSH